MRLLLVEDQPHLLRQLTRFLREAGYAVDATADGADDYLTKPFEPDELLARLRVIIRRGVGKSAVLVLGAVRVDTAARIVTIDGDAVALTPREYALVEYLAQHRGQLITRALIYDHLYGDEDSTLSNLLDMQVSNIRKKLGADFITTRRGDGYLIL